jgi:hypothetical protein
MAPGAPANDVTILYQAVALGAQAQPVPFANGMVPAPVANHANRLRCEAGRPLPII